MQAKPETFDQIRQLVRAEASIVLDDTKEYLMTARLSKLLPEFDLGSLDELAQELKLGRDRTLKKRVVEAMTTNETLFFRDRHPFHALQHQILPEAIDRRRAFKSLRVLSAACSTGQEPYTLAMMIKEHFAQLEGWSLQITATDYNEQVLERAKAGRYKQLEVGRGLPAVYLAKHFRRSGADWQLSASIRGMVRFVQQNITVRWPAFGPFDVILLRNVLIYFPDEVKTRVLSYAASALDRDGSLLLGAAENTLGLNVPLERAELGATSVYRRRDSQQQCAAG